MTIPEICVKRPVFGAMLVAMATEDYEMLTYEYLDLAPYNSHINVEQFTRELRDLLAPYFGKGIIFQVLSFRAFSGDLSAFCANV